MIWVAATLIAAASQTGRNAAQSGLTARIGTIGATGVRFVFGLPFALVFLAVAALCQPAAQPLPLPDPAALGFAAMGALAQIAATALMLVAMHARGFAVATALIKTEPVTLALIGAALLAEPLGLARMGAIMTATCGVVMVSGFDWRRAALAPVVIALLAGALFGLSAVGFRGAITGLDSGSFVLRASVILVITLALQSALVVLWLLLRDRAALRGMLTVWKDSLGAGFLGALASQFWFIAFALAPAANVRTLALVEVVLAQIVSGRVFHERTTPARIAGMALIVAGVSWLLLQ